MLLSANEAENGLQASFLIGVHLCDHHLDELNTNTSLPLLSVGLHTHCCTLSYRPSPPPPCCVRADVPGVLSNSGIGFEPAQPLVLEKPKKIQKFCGKVISDNMDKTIKVPTRFFAVVSPRRMYI